MDIALPNYTLVNRNGFANTLALVFPIAYMLGRTSKKVFGKFFRADNARIKQTQGTGIGLYTAKSIIELSGGKIGFLSEENEGSTFWFTLPAV